MDADRMPGDAEYAAAVAGMGDTYGHSWPAVGDRISWRIEAGTFDTGRVLEVLPGAVPRLLVRSEHCGKTYEIDARMYPAGNRLDF